ncbi:MAG: hypothetical protein M3P08_10215 [Thermoproteota archaeon]|nr:hypothetical protein [Thermoproteota archaeon]
MLLEVIIHSSIGGDISPFIACKNCDETISDKHTSKSYCQYREQGLQQQSKNSKGAKRILLVDDENDINWPSGNET